ncbi:hypothetical protein CMQ_1918 [Grosmannia clavigera kw1407]|uniref:Uncharacterized protein n=1 Tax=Grosmannia clavigera (strain kw1407 / UAMH 11150) TaxID=655863 RepID=F0XN99_GROCL|nr:uncharacterized protein CMQ_1918 [Grosmannia clavigera kw1407]EFX00837.1 hypothetical protein CMQ_1918 [Grosmannia clavigera kw1407]
MRESAQSTVPDTNRGRKHGQNNRWTNAMEKAETPSRQRRPMAFRLRHMADKGNRTDRDDAATWRSSPYVVLQVETPLSGQFVREVP